MLVQCHISVNDASNVWDDAALRVVIYANLYKRYLGQIKGCNKKFTEIYSKFTGVLSEQNASYVNS